MRMIDWRITRELDRVGACVKRKVAGGIDLCLAMAKLGEYLVMGSSRDMEECLEGTRLEGGEGDGSRWEGSDEWWLLWAREID